MLLGEVTAHGSAYALASDAVGCRTVEQIPPSQSDGTRDAAIAPSMTELVQILDGALALAQPLQRREALREFAEMLGADAVVPLVFDFEMGRFLPVPGSEMALAGGPGWSELLGYCTSPGIHHAKVAAHRGGVEVPATACCSDQAALVFVVCERSDAQLKEVIRALSALGAGWRTEIELLALQRSVRAAQKGAHDTQAMTVALEGARADVKSKAHSLELEHARTQVEDAARVKDEFLAVLGHELRNPLAPIVTALELMRLNGEPSREQLIIERHVAQLRRMVDDLLDVARTTRGKLKIQRVHVELCAAISQGIEMASPLLEGRQQVLNLSVANSGLHVDGDQGRLAQVVSNLLTNASRYSNPGSTIELIAEVEKDTVRMRVIDEGIGIDPNFLPEIFEPFSQGHRKAREGGNELGLGLGLGIVKTLIALHDGQVRAQSEGIDLGSEFVVELPRGKLSPRREMPEPEPCHVAASGTRVLIVDDNSDIAELMSEVLSRRGYQTQVAYDGPSALNMAATFEPTIGLLDLGLPVMDGYELAERLLGNPRHETMKLIAITGYGQAKDHARSIEHGFHAHLVKPVNIRSLTDLLGDIAKPN